MHSITAVLVVSLSLACGVSAHGYVQSMLINGQSYEGFLPFTDNYAGPNTKITRHIPDDGPVLDFTSGNMTCNVGAQDAQWRTNHTAAVDAGSDMSLTWVRWPNDHKGPVTVWMADCGGDCTNFDGTGSVWFKIDELGLVSGTTDTGTWASDLLIQNNITWTVTIPASLKPGSYLVRQEMLALHSAHAPQFYPSCAQVVVGGSGSSSPSSSEMVAIPGYYQNDTSTNIDIWQNGQTSYPIAGPPVTSLQGYRSTNAKNLAGGSVTAPQTDGGSAPATDSGQTGNSTTTAQDQTGDTAAQVQNATTTTTTTTTTDASLDTGAPSSAAAADPSKSKSGRCRAKKSKNQHARRHVNLSKMGW